MVNKPSGLLVHKSKIDQFATEFLLQKVRDQIGQHVYLVHRLDKPTSGLIALALDPHSAKLLSEQFQARQVYKEYQAIVRGYVNDQVIDYALKEQHDKMTDSLADASKQAQSAVTHLSTLATGEVPLPLGRYQSARYSLVKLIPKTGRKHQLRRHMAHIRHPIVGDTTHGDGKQNAFAREHLNLHRLALMATRLRFSHPETGEPIDNELELDPALLKSWRIINADSENNT